MSQISVSLPADGETIDAADYNTPITTIVNEINGELDNSNIASDAAIAGTKLANGAIDTTQLADGAVTSGNIADAAVTPEKRSGGYYIGTIAKTTLGTTGNKSVTGVGFTPKLVRFTIPSATAANVGFNICDGVMTADAQRVVLFAYASSKNSYSSDSYCLGWITGSSSTSTPALLGKYVSMDNDGFTINVETASNSFDLWFEAYG